MIEVEAEGVGVELVDERPARVDHLEHPVHVRGMKAMEMDRVRVAAGVLEPHPDAVAFRAADRRPRHRAVVGPRREPDAGSDLDLPVDRDEVVLSQRAAVGQPGHDAAVETRRERGRVEASGLDVPHRTCSAGAVDMGNLYPRLEGLRSLVPDSQRGATQGGGSEGGAPPQDRAAADACGRPLGGRRALLAGFDSGFHGHN